MSERFWQLVFVASAGLLVWSWALYPIALWLAARVRAPRAARVTAPDSALPLVSVIIAAHNEADVIGERLDNCLALDYPRERLDVIVVSDHSTDATNAIVETYADRGVRLVQAQARGKSSAQNDAVQVARGEVFLFTDADTLFDALALRALAAAFADPEVGCATGRIRWRTRLPNGLTSGGGMYWRFERFLWRLETRLGIMAWGSGACLAVRRGLFRPMERQFGDDCVLPLDVVAQGSRVVFVEEAVVEDVTPERASAEFRARTRMTLRSFSGTMDRRRAFRVADRPGVALAVVSHKLLRWFTPYLALVTVFASIVLRGHAANQVVLAAALLLTFAGVVGYLGDRRGRRIPLAAELYAFLVANTAWGYGVGQALIGRRMVAYRSEA